MIASAKAETKVWTEAELEALPEDGYLHEVVNGELVISPKNNLSVGLGITTRGRTKREVGGRISDPRTGFANA